jgi:hypothetical protein
MRRIAIASLFLLLVACSEDVKVIKPAYSKVFTGNTKKSWKITGLKWTGEGKDDISYSLRPCEKDDLYTFYANNEKLYEVSNGAIKCSSDEADLLVSDVWSFINATSTLTAIFPLLSDSALPFFVRKITSKEMTLEIYIDQDNKYSYQITMQSVSEE